MDPFVAEAMRRIRALEAAYRAHVHALTTEHYTNSTREPMTGPPRQVEEK